MWSFGPGLSMHHISYTGTSTPLLYSGGKGGNVKLSLFICVRSKPVMSVRINCIRIRIHKIWWIRVQANKISKLFIDHHFCTWGQFYGWPTACGRFILFERNQFWKLIPILLLNYCKEKLVNIKIINKFSVQGEKEINKSSIHGVLVSTLGFWFNNWKGNLNKIENIE